MEVLTVVKTVCLSRKQNLIAQRRDDFPVKAFELLITLLS